MLLPLYHNCLPGGHLSGLTLLFLSLETRHQRATDVTHLQALSELAEWLRPGTGLFTQAGNNDSPALKNNVKQMQGHINICPFPNDKAPRLSRREGVLPAQYPFPTVVQKLASPNKWSRKSQFQNPFG